VVPRPLVSVVIPAYNAGAYIAETLESALGQTYAHREIIVVDDGSTDDTQRRVQPYLQQIHYIRQENAGQGAACNAGLRAATGDFIAFLHADDLWLPEKLELQLQVTARHPESRMIVCDGVGFEGDRVVMERLLRGPLAARLDQEPAGELTGNFYRDLLDRNAITCPALTLIPRAVVERVGLVMEDRQASLDWEYNLRIARVGPITLHRHSLVRYRLLPTSVSGPSALRSFKYTLSDVAILRRHLQLCAAEDRPLVRRSLRRRVREQARDAYNYARRKDPAYARAYLRKLFRAVPEEPMTLLWLLGTWVPEAAVSVAARWLRRWVGSGA
jgi:glycosyltransferase involved in cell wall biosynthesis